MTNINIDPGNDGSLEDIISNTEHDVVLDGDRSWSIGSNREQFHFGTEIGWLGQGVVKDETSGHVDNLCCFLQPGEVALTWTDDLADPQYVISNDALQRLNSEVDARGRQLTVHRLHQPDPVVISADEADGVVVVEGTLPKQAGDRVVASYVNFYLCNGGAIVPIFDDPHDHEALETLARLLPGRQVIVVLV